MAKKHSQASFQHFNPRQIRTIWERDGGMCIYCGAPAQVIDHVVPSAKGGRSIVANGVCCCKKCNYKKGDKLEINMITRGIFWLLQCGEDMSWVDKVK